MASFGSSLRSGFVTRFFVVGTLIGYVLLGGDAATGVGGETWAQFRGPNASGISDAKRIPVTFSQDDYLWKVDLPGTGHSSPVLWEDMLLVTCLIEDDGEATDQRVVLCLDANTGKIVWTYENTFEPYPSHALNNFAASTPAIDAERVYVTWVSGKTFQVLALSHEGEEVWKRELSDYSSRFGAGASPIILDGKVIVCNSHPGNHSFLIALDAKTGETCWKVDEVSGFASFITPKVYQPKDGRKQVIFVSQANGLTSVDPTSGEVNWQLDCEFTLKTVATPTIAAGLVFVSAGQGSGGKESAVVRIPTSDGAKPEMAYKLRSGLPYVPTPVVVGGLVFMFDDSGRVTCFEPSTGEQLWRKKVGSGFFASPICVGGRIYNVSRKGEVVVLAATPEFKLLGESELHEGTHATPAVTDGRLYIRTYRSLICVGKE